ncbi:MAG: tetratricopeptide repeat protein [Elusimicrobiota bacterium]
MKRKIYFYLFSVLFIIIKYFPLLLYADVSEKWKESYNKLNEKYKLAEKYIQEHKYKEAELIYEGILSVEYDSNSRVFNNQNSSMISFYYNNLKNSIGTIKICQELIKKYPEQHISVIAGFYLGQAYESLNKKEKAINAYRECIKLHLKKFSSQITQNSFPTQSTQRIGLLLGLNEYGAAEFKKLINETPNDEINRCKERNMVNLIYNYTDCNKEPLQLYVKTIWEHLPTEQLFTIFNDILQKYPNCKLAPYIHFRRAELYHSRYNEEKKQQDFKTAMDEYNWILNSSTDYIFPESSYEGFYSRIICYKMNSLMKALTTFRIAQLVEDIDSEQAEKEYEKVIKLYPYATDFYNKSLKISSYIAILRMHLNKYKDKVPLPQVEKICKLLIDNYADTKWDGRLIGNIALNYLAQYYDRVNKITDSIKIRRILLNKYSSGIDWTDVAILRNLVEEIEKIYGNSTAIQECEELLKKNISKSMNLCAQFVLAELKLKSGAKFFDVADEYRKVIKIDPEMCKHVNICGCTPANLVIQAEHRAKSLEKFANYVGDPPNIELFKFLEPDYLKSSEVEEFLSVRTEFVLANIDELVNIISVREIILKIGEKSIYPVIDCYCKNNDTRKNYVIIEIILSLAKEYPDKTAKEIISFYHKSSTQLKQKLFLVISKIPHHSFENILKENLNSQNPEIRLGAIQDLYNLKSKDLPEILVKTLYDSDDNVKHTAIKLMGESMNLCFSKILIKRLRDQEPCDTNSTEHFIEEALSKYGDSILTDLEKEYLFEENEENSSIRYPYMSKSGKIRCSCINIAGRIKSQKSFEFLKKCLKVSRNPTLRWNVIYTLHKINPEKAHPIIEQILKSDDSFSESLKADIKSNFLEP